jgi:hypothetical protein
LVLEVAHQGWEVLFWLVVVVAVGEGMPWSLRGMVEVRKVALSSSPREARLKAVVGVWIFLVVLVRDPTL